MRAALGPRIAMDEADDLANFIAGCLNLIDEVAEWRGGPTVFREKRVKEAHDFLLEYAKGRC